MSDVYDRVVEAIASTLNLEKDAIKAESSFTEDLGADSLDNVELVMALEEEFGTEIPDDDAENIKTVQQAVDYIESHLEA